MIRDNLNNSLEADGTRSVYAADLDNDGDVDVLSASKNDNKIVWYMNLGSYDGPEVPTGLGIEP